MVRCSRTVITASVTSREEGLISRLADTLPARCGWTASPESRKHREAGMSVGHQLNLCFRKAWRQAYLLLISFFKNLREFHFSSKHSFCESALF